MPEQFRGTIRVASRIIDYLSSGLYHSPAACLKELVNNGYDADATRVDILVKPDADRIIIRDNGEGMSREEFQKHFDRISESHKRDRSASTRSGRPKIGKIGIGFIAANELCNVMQVYSTKKGSSELLHITINFDEMRKPPEERRRKGTDFLKADYVGEILEADRSEHYTEIFLEEVRGEAREILAGAKPQSASDTTISLYGLKPASIEELLRTTFIRTWKDFDPYSETMLKIALNVPIPYYEHWLPNHLLSKVKDIVRGARRLKFNVFYDGTELRKPIVFAPERKALVARFTYKGKNVGCHGYFYAQHGAIKPTELHGLLIRIRHAAVGEFDGTFLGFSKTEFSLIQSWVSAEIWADDRLEEAMNIDRRTLRETNPAYVEVRTAIHDALRNVLADAREKIYAAGSETRRTEAAQASMQSIVEVTKNQVGRVSPRSASELTKVWRAEAKREGSEKAFLRKFTVAELYEMVVEVAAEVLSRQELEKFLRRLTEKLLGK
jgi:hypothetical protein